MCKKGLAFYTMKVKFHTKIFKPLTINFRIFIFPGYIDSKSFKKFLYCCYKNANYLGPDGLVDIEKSVNVFRSETSFGEAVRRCGDLQVGSDTKEAVFNFFKCFQDTVPYKLTI